MNKFGLIPGNGNFDLGAIGNLVLLKVPLELIKDIINDSRTKRVQIYFDDEDNNFNRRAESFAHSMILQEEDPRPLVMGGGEVMETKHDITQQRPGFQVVDNVSYYGIASLMTLLYANASEGISIPAVFDAEKQSM